MEGWIKLYRKLLENPIMRKPGMLQLWIYCLLKANHETRKISFGKQDITIMPGQFVTGRFELSSILGVKPSTIYKRISALQRRGFLNTKSNNKNTLITIVNWELYQSAEIESNNNFNNKVTTKEQQSNTNKNVKNDKNKDIRGKSIPPSIEQVKKYCQERNNKIDPEYWIDFYASKNWMIGKNKMKDWKAAVRTWEHNKKQNKKTAQSGNFKQREYDDEYYEKLYENT